MYIVETLEITFGQVPGVSNAFVISYSTHLSPEERDVLYGTEVPLESDFMDGALEFMLNYYRDHRGWRFVAVAQVLEENPGRDVTWMLVFEEPEEAR